MAHDLDIIYGSTTVHLTASGIDVLNYDLNGAPDEAVTEEIELLLAGSSVSDLSSKIASIQRAIEQARKYNTDRVGDQVFLSLQPDGYASAYTSEILDAMFAPFEGVIKSRIFSQYKATYRLIVTRRSYWQGAAVQVTIENPNGSGTSGINVYNCRDGSAVPPNTRINYFDNSVATDIGGDLPAPAKITLTNVSGSTKDIGNLWIGLNTYTNGSSNSEFVTGGTETADAAASNGLFLRSPTMTSSYQGSCGGIGLYSLLTAFGKQPVGIIARFNAKPPTNTYGYLYCSRQLTDEFILSPSTKLQLLGTVVPQSWGTDWAVMYLYYKNSGGGVLDMDYWGTVPMSNYARITLNDNSITNNGYIIYDSSLLDTSPTGYFTTSGGSIRYYATYGTGIFLAPNKGQRFMVFWDSSTGENTITEYFSVKLSYYPRRRTL